MDNSERIKDLEDRVALLQEAIRIQNRVTEGSMEAANYWRDQAMKLLNRQAGEVFRDDESA